GSTALSNGIGVHVASGRNNVIGSVSDHNVISGNTGPGVLVETATGMEPTTGTQLLGNLIGPDAAGVGAVGNGTAGVIVQTGAVNTTIGGAVAGAGNVISGNQAVAANGIQVQGNAIGTQIVGNVIGLRLGGTGLLPNSEGILIKDT